MKKIMGIGAGLAALAAIYVGQLWAQQGGAPAAQPPAQTRVAFVNVSKVFLDWEKFKAVKTEMDKLIEPKLKKKDELIKNITGWKKMMAEDEKFNRASGKFDPKAFEIYENGIRQAQRELEDLGREFEQTIAPKSDQQNVQLYKEVYQAAQDVANRYSFQVVMGYMEPSQTDLYGIMNIKRKVQGMQMGCVTALYVAPNLDLSAAVIDELNRNHRPAAGAAAPTSQPKH